MSDLRQIRENMKSVKVLYAEDEPEVQEQTLQFLKKVFKDVDSASNGLEGLELFEKNGYDLVITDLKMPKMNGRDMLSKIHEIDKDAVLVVMTASDSNIDATQTVCDAYLYKPISFTEFVEVLEPLQERLLKK